MSIFKRLSSTFVSRVDQLVGEIEDHDAVAESMIRQARQTVAKSKVRCKQLQNDGNKLRQRLDHLKSQENKWAQRAASMAAQDEDKALQCLRQRRDCQQEIETLKQTLEKHDALVARVQQDIHVAESRVTDIIQQRKMLRTRQSAAEAINAMNSVDENMLSDMSATFERWETRITDTELQAGSYTIDETLILEKEFSDQEEKESLKLELDALIYNKENNHDNNQ